MHLYVAITQHKKCPFPCCSRASSCWHLLHLQHHTFLPHYLPSSPSPQQSLSHTVPHIFSNQRWFYVFIKLWCQRQHTWKSCDLWSLSWSWIIFVPLSSCTTLAQVNWYMCFNFLISHRGTARSAGNQASQSHIARGARLGPQLEFDYSFSLLYMCKLTS